MYRESKLEYIPSTIAACNPQIYNARNMTFVCVPKRKDHHSRQHSLQNRIVRLEQSAPRVKQRCIIRRRNCLHVCNVAQDDSIKRRVRGPDGRPPGPTGRVLDEAREGAAEVLVDAVLLRGVLRGGRVAEQEEEVGPVEDAEEAEVAGEGRGERGVEVVPPRREVDRRGCSREGGGRLCGFSSVIVTS